MGGIEPNPASPIDRAAAMVRAEPKKATTLAMLVLLLAFCAYKTFGRGPGARPTAAKASVGGGGGGASYNLPRPRTGVQSARSASSPTGRGQMMKFIAEPAPALGRNVFLVKLDHFPRDGSRAPERTASGPGFWDQLAKSFTSKADQEKARRFLLENIRERASRLELQSIVTSNGATMAMVNGKLLGEGDEVEGFRVVRIEGTRVVVEREGVRVELVFKYAREARN
jgi:hypothetical protein